MISAPTFIALLTGLALTTASAAARTTWYVDDDNCPGPGSGTIEDPFCSIQEAIDAAQDGDTVLVAPGTYYEEVNFNGKAIALRTSGGPELTTIDGADTNDSVVVCMSGEGPDTVLDGFTVTGGGPGGAGIVCCSASPTISNCIVTGNTRGGIDSGYTFDASPTVTNCTISGNSGGGIVHAGLYGGTLTVTDCAVTSNAGGGILLDGGSATISACTISDNSGGVGAGISSWDCAVTISGCTISGNTADGEGGGVCCAGDSSAVTIIDTIISGNSANHGGALYCHDGECVLTNCIISENSAGPASWGGGAVLCEGGYLTVSKCSFQRNVAYGAHSPGYDRGGAVFCAGAAGSIANCTFSENSAAVGGAVYFYYSAVSLINCKLSGNTAAVDGGGLACYGSDAAITNCTISANLAANEGGAVACYAASPTITNCTITANEANNGGAVYCLFSGNPMITNCILWGDTPQEIYVPGGDPVVVGYSDVQGGWPGAGNVNADPLFVDPDGPDNDPNTWEDNDYRLGAGSPCIDAGDNSAVPASVTTDLDGNPRFVDDPETVDTGSGTPPIVDMGAYEFQVNGGGATATIYDAWWTYQVDQDGDGCKRSARLNWDPDVIGCSGSLSVFEKIYWKPAPSGTWTLLTTTEPHTINDCSGADWQYQDWVFYTDCGQFDWKIEIYRDGESTPDDTLWPVEDSDLDNHEEERVADDTLPPTLVSSGCYVTPDNVDRGGVVTFQFRVRNPNSFPMTVGLGASIRPQGSTEWSSDWTCDVYASAPPGESDHARCFNIPADAEFGPYDAAFGLWETIGEGEMWDYLEIDDAFSVNVKLAAPYFNQDSTEWCWATSVAMLLQHYGIDCRPWQVAAALGAGPTDRKGIWDVYLYLVAYHGGFGAWSIPEWYSAELSWLFVNRIEEVLASGRPIYLGSQAAGHAVVLVGFDNDNVYVNDPSGALVGGTQLVRAPMAWADFLDHMNVWWNWFTEIGLVFPQPDAFAEAPPPATTQLLGDGWGMYFENNVGGVHRVLALRWDGSPPYSGYHYNPSPNHSWWQPDTDGLYVDYEFHASRADTLIIQPSYATCALPDETTLLMRIVLEIRELPDETVCWRHVTDAEWVASPAWIEQPVGSISTALTQLTEGVHRLVAMLEGSADGGATFTEYDCESFYFGLYGPPAISGYIRTAVGAPIGGVLVSASNAGGSDTSGSDGFYSLWVGYGWSGQVTPSAPGYTFDPPSRSYANVITNLTDQDYTGTPDRVDIWGYVRTADGGGLGDVLVSADNDGGSDTTDPDGFYRLWVFGGWSGRVTPSKEGYVFDPPSRGYSAVFETQAYQDYVGTPVSCPGDLDGDGDIDLSDLAQLLSNYGETSGMTYWDGDLDCDGDVDLTDLAALLAVYGTTCE